VRAFIAVDLSAEVRAAVVAAQTVLREAAPRADVRWAETEKLHLTIKFLGEVAEAKLDAVVAALAETAARHRPFWLAAGGVGGYPSLGRPRVIWAGLASGHREIGLLAADVERTVEPLGFPREARPFSGHVTLGRVRSPRGVSRVTKVAADIADRAFGQWQVGEMVLYRSHLRKTGSVYEPIARFELGAGSVRENR
jgi:2'-5' RNA ligase